MGVFLNNWIVIKVGCCCVNIIVDEFVFVKYNVNKNKYDIKIFVIKIIIIK